jgi:carbon monoxide dehydrogenase subunit G
MINVQITLDIKAPPEVVFDLLADHTKHPQWDPNMIQAALFDAGPIGPGSKGKTIGELRGRRVESDIYYDSYDRPTYVSGGTSSGPVEATQSCRFKPTDNGTRIDWKMSMNFKGPMRVLQPFLKSTVKKQRERTLTALKNYIERSSDE